jgi:Fe-S cluster assembly ATP-binding protein
LASTRRSGPKNRPTRCRSRPSHPNARPAAEASQCAAEQGQFWQYYERLFADQTKLSDAELKQSAAALGMDMEMMKRAVNVGFSGGEKKRNEMVQMGIIDPRLAILDETDSGLDIDALRVVGEGINRIMRKPDKAVLLITHYERLLEYVAPDFVHVLVDGRIVRSGDIELARDLERDGYVGVAA